MFFDDLVIDLIFIWMGVGMSILLVNYRAIKNSQRKKKENDD